MIGREEVNSAIEVLESGLLTSPSIEGGERVRAFENALAGYLGCKRVVAVNSGTSALYASLLALGVGRGDEVLVPTFTFLATASAVLMTGARPIFVDIGADGYNMDPSDLKSKITRRSKAVIPVHLYGHPAQIDVINEVAGARGLPVIEDAAQALGSVSKGRKAGTLSAMGCFSFYPSKVITCGEGGAIATNDDRLWESLRSIRTHGMKKGYDSTTLGSNLRMPEVEASIARVQLGKLDGFLAARRRNALHLTERLEGHDGFSLPRYLEGASSNWYLYTISVKSERDRVISVLNEKGVEAVAYYRTPIHKTALYQKLGYKDLHLPRSGRASRQVISIPVHPGVTREDVEFMVETFLDATG